MPVWLQAGCWGGLAGGALLLGAVAGYWIKLPKKRIAGIMAFGSGGENLRSNQDLSGTHSSGSADPGSGKSDRGARGGQITPWNDCHRDRAERKIM